MNYRTLLLLLLALTLIGCSTGRRGDDDDSGGGSQGDSDGAFLLYPPSEDGYVTGYLLVPRENNGTGCDELLTPGGLQSITGDEDYVGALLYLGDDLGAWERDYQHFLSGLCDYDEENPSDGGLVHCFTGNNFPGPGEPMDTMIDAEIAVDSYGTSSVGGEVTYGDGTNETFLVEHCGTFNP